MALAFIQHHAQAVLGPAIGALSPEEEHAVRAARLGQGLPAVERAADPGVTVRTTSSAPVAQPLYIQGAQPSAAPRTRAMLASCGLCLMPT